MARNNDPIPAEPTHHQADIPSRYPSPEAPMIEPAPMFAAKKVEKVRPGPSFLSATKNESAPLTRLEIQSPSAIRPREYATRTPSWRPTGALGSGFTERRRSVAGKRAYDGTRQRF
jgi:hypothetical protein